DFFRRLIHGVRAVADDLIQLLVAQLEEAVGVGQLDRALMHRFEQFAAAVGDALGLADEVTAHAPLGPGLVYRLALAPTLPVSGVRSFFAGALLLAGGLGVPLEERDGDGGLLALGQVPPLVVVADPRIDVAVLLPGDVGRVDAEIETRLAASATIDDLA